MQDKIAIILTGTIVTNSILTIHINPEIRKKEYLQAIHFYTQFAPVYFLENSIYPVDLDPDFTSVNNLFIRKMPISLYYEKGKGYQEFEMIDRWLNEERDPPPRWFKISGRYIFRNFDAFLDECLKDRKHKLVIDQYFYCKFASTVMFCVTTNYYCQHLRDIYQSCDDWTGEFIEIVVFKKLTEDRDSFIRLFRNVHNNITISGSTGSQINNSGILYYIKKIDRQVNMLASNKYIISRPNFKRFKSILYLLLKIVRWPEIFLIQSR
jgi:hypothetical protein